MTMKQQTPEVRMTTEGCICAISLDSTAKKNVITPELMSQLNASERQDPIALQE